MTNPNQPLQSPPPAQQPFGAPAGSGYPNPYMGPTPSPDDKTWGMFAHLAALGGYIIPLVGSIVGPLIVWLMRKDQSPFVDDQGKESLNFQILVMILVVLSVPLWCVVIGVFITPLIGLMNLVFIIVAAVQSQKGIAYRYPVNLRLIK